CKSGSAQHRRPRRRALAYRNRPSKDPLEKNPLAMEEIIFLTKGKQGPDLETASNHVNLAGVQQADPGKDPYDQDALSRAGQDVLRQQGKPKYRSFLATSCDGCPESPPTFRDPGYALRARGGCGPSRVRPASPSLVLGRRPAQWHFECFAAGPRGRSQGGASVPEHVRSHVPTRECSPATSTGSATPWPQAKSRSPAVIFSRRTSG